MNPLPAAAAPDTIRFHRPRSRLHVGCRRAAISALSAVFLLGWGGPAGAQECSVRVVVAYYSASGNTEAMARAVAGGASTVDGTTVIVGSVDEITTEQILGAHAIVIGSPVYNGNVAPQVQEFMNSWPFSGEPLRDKLGAAFVSAGGISAGEETTQLSILRSMLLHGLIVMGGEDWRSAFGASAITEEEPFASEAEDGVPNRFLRKGRGLGVRVATQALRQACGPAAAPGG